MVILNFHGIGPITRDIDAGEKDCWINLRFLEEILDYVAPRKDIKLTVDDGNESDVTFLLPALKERNLKCTFFLCSDRTDKPTFLNKDQILEIRSAGMSIGNHGKYHKSWKGLTGESLLEEILESKESLELLIADSITAAACPFGGYDRFSLKQLKKLEYDKVYTSDAGRCSPSDWLTRRNTIRQSMSIDDVKSIINRKPSVIQEVKMRTKTLIKRLR